MKKKEDLTYNERLSLVGINTIHTGERYNNRVAYLEYNGKKILRPDACKCIGVCLKEFGLNI